MKLHFRSSGGDSYSHSVTPLLTSGSASGSTVTPAGHGNSVPSRLQPVMSMSDANSTRTRGSAPLGNPATRHTAFPARCGQGQAVLYVLGIVLVFALPFAVPVAYSHAIKAADRFSTTVRHGFTQTVSNPALSIQEQSPLSMESTSALSSGNIPAVPIPQSSIQSTGDSGGSIMQSLSENGLEHDRTFPRTGDHPSSLASGPKAFGAEAERRIGSTELTAGDSSHAPSIGKATNSVTETDWEGLHEPTAYSLPSSDKGSLPAALSEVGDGGHVSSNPSHSNILEPASRDLVSHGRHEPQTDPWIPHVEIENGKILMARTFERRLNAEVAPRLAQRGEELWGRGVGSCTGAAVTFSIDQSPTLEAELHIATKCGGGKSCVIKPQLRDFRNTEISLGDGADSVHYVQTKSQDSREVHKWGPLRGTLKVILLDSTILHITRSCEDPLASSSRLISVRDMRNAFQPQHEESSKLSTGPSMKALVEEALSYHAKPHHHMTAADSSAARQASSSGYLSKYGSTIQQLHPQRILPKV